MKKIAMIFCGLCAIITLPSFANPTNSPKAFTLKGEIKSTMTLPELAGGYKFLFVPIKVTGIALPGNVSGYGINCIIAPENSIVADTFLSKEKDMRAIIEIAQISQSFIEGHDGQIKDEPNYIRDLKDRGFCVATSNWALLPKNDSFQVPAYRKTFLDSLHVKLVPYYSGTISLNISMTNLSNPNAKSMSVSSDQSGNGFNALVFTTDSSLCEAATNKQYGYTLYIEVALPLNETLIDAYAPALGDDGEDFLESLQKENYYRPLYFSIIATKDIPPPNNGAAVSGSGGSKGGDPNSGTPPTLKGN